MNKNDWLDVLMLKAIAVWAGFCLGLFLAILADGGVKWL
jgi:hypothetical protein